MLFRSDQLVVDIFTAGLPYNMYKELYNIQPPLIMYEDWRSAAIEQQKRFIHLKGRQEGFKQRLEKFKVPHNNQQGRRVPFGAPKYEPMDTSPGRTRARLAKAEDFMPCYVTAGTFARRGLSSTAKTLRSLSGCFEVLSTKSKKRT